MVPRMQEFRRIIAYKGDLERLFSDILYYCSGYIKTAVLEDESYFPVEYCGPALTINGEEHYIYARLLWRDPRKGGPAVHIYIKEGFGDNEIVFEQVLEGEIDFFGKIVEVKLPRYRFLIYVIFIPIELLSVA